VQHIQDFWIFKADSNGEPGGAQNEYSYVSGDPTDCANWNQDLNGWPSTSRQTTSGSTPLDILGIRLTFQHNWITGVPPFSGSITWTEDTIMRSSQTCSNETPRRMASVAVEG
jgi:hypothetical protein